MKNILKITALALGLFLACTRTPKNVSYLEKAKESPNPTQAIVHINKTIELNKDPQLLLKASQLGLHIINNDSQNNIQSAFKINLRLRYLRLVLLYSQDREERLASQKKIANIYFNDIRNYNGAIDELSQLLDFKLSRSAKLDIQLKIARSYYHIGKLEQAQIELQKIQQSDQFEVLVLQGDILLGQRNFQQASSVYESLIEKFPQKSITNKVFLSLSTCYEEQKEFQKAITFLSKFLEDYKSSLDASERDFISMKIQRLERIYKMQPGVLQPGKKYRR